ncbi:hypothetical protein LOTGIDRAFT_154127 [Lottia gigantea]|uniref:Caspase family p20 domain-containing protein n=1 Tax=Lottia gigantea TaxID=225164 RepID=V4A292_LOTGI|nr:hypothetical protein LOTGIDRAFT_154127 [Lottia gigantea]ESO89050.1 hypothetical protein LOTGIDRAFT_154127 [Lottia gigantea]
MCENSIRILDQKDCKSPLCVEGDRYCFHRKNIGKALIFNQSVFHHLSSRPGSKVDRENIERSLTHLGFQVDTYVNLSTEDVKSVLDAESARDYSLENSFMCVFMSHGSEGVIHCEDGPLDISTILQYFDAKNCPSLFGKPKLFIVNACRGDKMDPGVDVVDSIEDSLTFPIPFTLLDEDFILVYSVVSGYASARDFRTGSCFISALSETLLNHGKSMDFVKLMTRVNAKIAFEFERKGGKKQMPCVYSMLKKDLHF